MSETPLSPEALRGATTEISRLPADDRATAARLAGELLLAHVGPNTAALSPSAVDAQLTAAGATTALAETPSGRPFEVLRTGARNTAERALVSALLVEHVRTLLERRDGVHAVCKVLAALDWLEFEGRYPPYTALRILLDGTTLERFEDVLRDAPVDAPTPRAVAAVLALRDAARAPMKPPPAAVPVRERTRPTAVLTIAGEVEGWRRSLPWRIASIVTGWALARGAMLGVLRVVFSMRRPATLSLEGDLLRVVGHSEILGRTLRTFDVRYPVANLLELRREGRYPILPVAVSVFALSVGSIFGARAVVEGARASYFPLIAIGLGLLCGGIFFDLVLRALFPGLTGRGRLVLRSRDERAVVLSGLPIGEIDRLLSSLDEHFTGSLPPAPRAPVEAPRAAEARG